MTLACPLEGAGSLDELARDRGVKVLAAPLLAARFTSNPLRLLVYLVSFARAIPAFRALVERARPDLLYAASVCLAIVGAALFNDDHRHEAALCGQVARLGLGDAVRFMGARDDMPALLRAADLLVLNAVQEPFGLVLLEAMASGTQVLATRVGGVPEIVMDGPPDGWSSPADRLR